MTAIEFPKEQENLFNNLLREIRGHYRQYNMTEPRRKGKVIYLEELKYVKELNFNFTSKCDIKVNNKNIITYLNNVKKITIKANYKLTNELDYLPNKSSILEIEIDNSGATIIDLSNFDSLKKATITNNNELERIKGLDKLSKLKDLRIANNILLVDDKTTKAIASLMTNSINMELDLLYYPKIVNTIRKEYSKYRQTFREIKWVETLLINKKNSIIHNTKTTATFYSKIEDILDRILPDEELDDYQATYLIYWWLIINVQIKATESETAFDALTKKVANTEGYNRLLQLMLYTYSLNTYNVPAYLSKEANIHANSVSINDLNNKKANTTLVKVIIEDNHYYLNPSKELIDKKTKEINQTCFMRTFEELDTNWFPLLINNNTKSRPLNKTTRSKLVELKLANNKGANETIIAQKVLKRFELHLINKKGLDVEYRIKKEQIEDLLFLGIINNPVQSIMNNIINKEYKELKNNMR